MQFFIGNIVYIKSESKEMTISHIYSSQNNGCFDMANCVWLDKDNHLWQANFPLLILEKRVR
ncbi:DUF2158 domain-containing protein [Salmonella enterica subsp. enterica serovar Anatum]|nr:DUF2158 domain-containing protein [Salmonella enterica subsp. enterica serovar Muenchen]EBM2656148.1 DUF2158 domain-containing protein [Salmonella enterica]ECA8306793.1 DUF2158 domain-containing protein [Salmonella enterica subsp. enterica serovar Anatum]ECD5229908.1 DUF2158 domain-containing protein [Salmonella enterica subsp. enterica serovar Braenderup]EHF5033874.1 DUF2158 domain-containing protein [Enterobacter hormaechei]MBT1797423.1 DUF2158 domain-containing protein [Enterobacter horm